MCDAAAKDHVTALFIVPSGYRVFDSWTLHIDAEFDVVVATITIKAKGRRARRLLPVKNHWMVWVVAANAKRRCHDPHVEADWIFSAIVQCPRWVNVEYVDIQLSAWAAAIATLNPGRGGAKQEPALTHVIAIAVALRRVDRTTVGINTDCLFAQKVECRVVYHRSSVVREGKTIWRLFRDARKHEFRDVEELHKLRRTISLIEQDAPTIFALTTYLVHFLAVVPVIELLLSCATFSAVRWTARRAI